MVLDVVAMQFAVHVYWMPLTGLILWTAAVVMCREVVKGHKSGIGTCAAPPQGWASLA